jgi:hypothetical protein
MQGGITDCRRTPEKSLLGAIKRTGAIENAWTAVPVNNANTAYAFMGNNILWFF